MTDQRLQISSPSPDHTRRIAEALAASLGPGDTILLDGPIGAGKSHFARSAILAMLTEAEDVPSPTYTLVQTYQTPRGEVWHADLYRLGSPEECHELGLWAAFDDAICLVEWPDRLGDAAPETVLTLKIEPQAEPNSRALRFSWMNARWTARMEEVFGDRSAFA